MYKNTNFTKIFRGDGEQPVILQERFAAVSLHNLARNYVA